MKQSGYILLEALVSIAILGVLVISILPSINFLLQRSRRSAVNTDANLLLQEGMEVMYNVFASNWDAYPNGTYRIVVDETSGRPTWLLIPDTEEQNIEAKFTRIIRVSEVNRQTGNGKIGSGPIDPKSRLVTTTIVWNEGTQPNTLSADLLLVNTR